MANYDIVIVTVDSILRRHFNSKDITDELLSKIVGQLLADMKHVAPVFKGDGKLSVTFDFPGGIGKRPKPIHYGYDNESGEYSVDKYKLLKSMCAIYFGDNFTPPVMFDNVVITNGDTCLSSFSDGYFQPQFGTLVETIFDNHQLGIDGDPEDVTSITVSWSLDNVIIHALTSHQIDRSMINSLVTDVSRRIYSF